jgi:hypothetical protein
LKRKNRRLTLLSDKDDLSLGPIILWDDHNIRLIELKSGPQNLAPFFSTHFFGVRIIDADLRSHVNYVLIVSSTVDQRTLYRPLISYIIVYGLHI